MTTRYRLWALVCVLSLVASATGAEPPVKKSVEADTLGDTFDVHRNGELYLGGQPDRDELAQLKQAGIERIISLRTEGELRWDEAAAASDAGLEFINIPILRPDDLTDAVFARIRDLAQQSKETPTLLHCASANRVGAVWLVHRVLDQNVPLEKATEEAKQVGLQTPVLEQKARDYIERQQQQQSVPPGINDNFLSAELDVDEWIERFEIESREVFAARERILAATEAGPGDRIADVGAGTGFFTRMFSDRVGSQGWVFAVDISPRFIEHIASQTRQNNLSNVTPVLCQESSVNLPPESVDIVFICDTYHHFEYPAATLTSIHRALRPDGKLIVIDFERIPGVSREFILGHVRAGKAVFRKEIEGAGFEMIEEVSIPAFKENYFLRFQKSSR